MWSQIIRCLLPCITQGLAMKQFKSISRLRPPGGQGPQPIYPGGFILLNKCGFISASPVIPNTVNPIKNHTRRVTVVNCIKMPWEMVFWEPLPNVLDMLPCSYIQRTGGSTHILQLAWALYDVSYMGALTSYEFPNFIFFMICFGLKSFPFPGLFFC